MLRRINRSPASADSCAPTKEIVKNVEAEPKGRAFDSVKKIDINTEINEAIAPNPVYKKANVPENSRLASAAEFLSIMGLPLAYIRTIRAIKSHKNPERRMEKADIT